MSSWGREGGEKHVRMQSELTMHPFATPGAEGRGGCKEVWAQCPASVRPVFCVEAAVYFLFGMNGILTEKKKGILGQTKNPFQI